MRLTIMIVGWLMSAAALAGDFERTLTAEAWARPRSGSMLLHWEAVRATVRDWSQVPDGEILIRHPGGEAGSLWAHELRDWLVALGVPSSRILTQPGNGRPDAVSLRVRGGD